MVHSGKISAFAVLLLFGCAAPDSEPGELGVIMSALSPCDEEVPANRYIDGVPAYAQCTSTEMSAIYSNNGVDTSTTKLDNDWVRTQWSGGFQCTELATRYMRFVWDVTFTPRGNAGTWCDSPPPADSGLTQSTTPVHGDLIVFAPGSCGAAQGTGHVAVVDTVDMAAGKVSVVEQNRANRGSYRISCAKCFLHMVANDGSKAPTVVKGDGDAERPSANDAGSTDGAATAPRDAGVSRGPTAGDDKSDAGRKPADGQRDPASGERARDAAAEDEGERDPLDSEQDESDDDMSDADDPEEDDDDGALGEDENEGGEGEDDAEALGAEGCSLGGRGAPAASGWLLLASLVGMSRRRARARR